MYVSAFFLMRGEAWHGMGPLFWSRPAYTLQVPRPTRSYELPQSLPLISIPGPQVPILHRLTAKLAFFTIFAALRVIAKQNEVQYQIPCRVHKGQGRNTIGGMDTSLFHKSLGTRHHCPPFNILVAFDMEWNCAMLLCHATPSTVSVSPMLAL